MLKYAQSALLPRCVTHAYSCKTILQVLDCDAATSTPHREWMQSETRGYVCNWHPQWTCMELTIANMSYKHANLQITVHIDTERLALFQEPDSLGCLLEITWNGQKEISVGNSIRKFLQDGDEVILTGCCKVQ